MVLVNGCLTQEISIQIGLKQGDPRAPFLFLLVEEGLNEVFSRVMDLNHFSSFRVGSPSLVISHLQYVDDIVTLTENSVENIWSIKDILLSFELTSSLRVKFSKSNLIGISLDSSFLDSIGEYFHYQIESFIFMFLGFWWGITPNVKSTWKPLMSLISRWLDLWAHRYVSQGRM